MRSSLARLLLVLAAAAPLAACTVGDITGPGGGDDDGISGDDDGDDTAAGPDAGVEPSYSLTMTPPQVATTLGTESHYTITLASTNFTGPVSLSVSGLPADWMATFEPTAVTMPLDGTTTVDLTITVPTTAAGATTQIGVNASAAPGTHEASAQLAVANEYIMTIGDGTGTGAHAFPSNLQLKLGATLRIMDADTGTPHRIHSDGGDGFPHQDASMEAGQEYAVTPGDLGGYRFYCHDHGEGTGATNLTVVQ
jgi:plastocyanin